MTPAEARELAQRVLRLGGAISPEIAAAEGMAQVCEALSLLPALCAALLELLEPTVTPEKARVLAKRATEELSPDMPERQMCALLQCIEALYALADENERLRKRDSALLGATRAIRCKSYWDSAHWHSVSAGKSEQDSESAGT